MRTRARLVSILVAALFALSIPGCKRTKEKFVAPPATPPPSAGTAAPAGPMGQKPPPAVRIAELKAELAKDPKNTAKWVELGNIHYDMREREEAVNAYARALELNPKDVNVVTDQGVMYRELGQLEKALANFKRARELDPKHVPAAFNLGVIQAQLEQKEAAIKSLEAVVQLDPSGPAGASARKLIESLKAPAPKGGAKAPAPKSSAPAR